MPFDPSAYVFQPRPLQQYDFGQAWRDLIQARQGKRQSDLYRQNLDDTNTRYAADYVKHGYDKELDRYNKGEAIAQKMREAGQANDKATFEALRPSLLELGGTVEQQGNDWIVKSGQRPNLPGMDVQGARRQIFGGAGPNLSAPTMGPSFQMRSNVGPGAAYGDRGTDPAKNQFETLPGASAAAAGLVPPYPGRAGVQPPESAGAQPQPQALTGPNPTTPPALSPYRINFDEAAERNRQQTRPFYEAVTKAAPVGAQGLFKNFGEGMVGTGMPLERAAATGKDTLNELAGVYRGGLQADATRAQLGLRQQGMEFSQAQRLRDRANQRGDAISRQHGLPKLIQAARDADIALEEIDKAEAGNPDAVNAAIVSIVKSKQDRVSDADFRNASEGARNIWEAMKRGIAETLFVDGFTTDHARDLREVVGILKASHEKAFRLAQQQLLQPLASGRLTPEEREWYIVAAAQNIPIAEYWDPVVKDFMGLNGVGAQDAPPEPEDNLGVVPRPRVEQRAAVAPSPRVSPNGVPLVKSDRVPEKPPAKPPTKSKYEGLGVDPKTQKLLEDTDAELKSLGIEL